MFLLLAWPWPPVVRGWARLHAEVASAVVGRLSFGSGGHARIEALERPVLGDTIAADSVLRLTVEGFAGELRYGFNAHREAFLPALVALFVVAVARLPGGHRRAAALLVLPLVWVVLLATQVLTTLCLFALDLEGVVAAGRMGRGALELVRRVVLLPPTARSVAGLSCGLAVVWWVRRRAR